MTGNPTTIRDRAKRMVPAALAIGMAGALATAGPAAAASRPVTSAGTVTTIAGGVGGPGAATALSVNVPQGVTGANGHLYVAAGDTVWSVNQATGAMSAVAGTGSHAGPPGNGGPAARATTGYTAGVTVDGAGNLLIADPGTYQVRVVAAKTGTFYGRSMTAGHIYAIAGTGQPGYSGNGGLATAAKLHDPQSVALDPAGNVLITDRINVRIRVVAEKTGTFYGQAMTAGHIYTVAGTGHGGYSGDGGLATKATLAYPSGAAADASGNLLIADTANNRVRVVAGKTGTFYGQAMTAGHIYTVAGTGTEGFTGDGGKATAAALNYPSGVVTDSAGNLVIADMGSNRVRVVAAKTGTFYGQAMTAGDIYLVAGNGTAGFAGDGGPATAASFDDPQGVGLDSSGNLLIADEQNNRVRVVAAKTGTFYGKHMTAGDAYSVAGNGQGSYSGDGGPATAAQLAGPGGVVMDGAGNLLIADSGNNRIRVKAAVTGTLYGRSVTAGRIYTIAGTGQEGDTGDGGPAVSAELSGPQSIALDQAGNLVIADTYSVSIRVVAAKSGTFYGQSMTAGDIYSIVGKSAGLSYPDGVAVDSAGNVLIADTDADLVRVLAAKTGTFYGVAMTAGHLYKVAGDGQEGFAGDGGKATAAELASPQGLATDGTGNLLIADAVNNRIRVVAAKSGTFYGQAMTAGHIYTIAGDGKRGASGNHGPATQAALDFPDAVLADAAGNVLISDFGSNLVRVVAAKSGTFYGQSMTAGDIYIVVGDGKPGLSDGPVGAARVYGPAQLALTGAGALLIADTGNNRIREARWS